MEVPMKGQPLNSAGTCLCWGTEKLGTISRRHNSKTRQLLKFQNPIFTLTGEWLFNQVTPDAAENRMRLWYEKKSDLPGKLRITPSSLLKSNRALRTLVGRTFWWSLVTHTYFNLLLLSVNRPVNIVRYYSHGCTTKVEEFCRCK